MAKKTNKLVEVMAKVDYAASVAKYNKQDVNHPGGLWYHAIGLFNAYYAINEELKNRTQNDPDTALSDSVRLWRSNNGPKIGSFFKNARNNTVHQGDVQVEYFTEWEDDYINDTSYPIIKAHITIQGTNINQMKGEEFLNLCEMALDFMRNGILEIDADYKKRGGTVHALPNPGNLSQAFANFQL